MNKRPPAAAPSSRDAAGEGRRFVLFDRRPTPSIGCENERLLYGALLPDVRFLRQRGFGVHREGDRYRVGNRLMEAGQLKRIAARERRLVAEGRLVAGRRLVGGS
jgi:hypothetical protein